MPVSKEIAAVFTAVTDPDEMAQLFEELFSPKEVADVGLRWQLLRDLHRGEAQRHIAAKYKISLCKITRGSKILKQDGSVTRNILDKMYGGDDEQQAE